MEAGGIWAGGDTEEAGMHIPQQVHLHTPIYVSSCSYMCVLILLYVSSYSDIYLLILLNVCPHTPTCVSSYSFVCVLILVYMCPQCMEEEEEDLRRL